MAILTTFAVSLLITCAKDDKKCKYAEADNPTNYVVTQQYDAENDVVIEAREY